MCDIRTPSVPIPAKQTAVGALLVSEKVVRPDRMTNHCPAKWDETKHDAQNVTVSPMLRGICG